MVGVHDLALERQVSVEIGHGEFRNIRFLECFATKHFSPRIAAVSGRPASRSSAPTSSSSSPGSSGSPSWASWPLTSLRRSGRSTVMSSRCRRTSTTRIRLSCKNKLRWSLKMNPMKILQISGPMQPFQLAGKMVD